MQPTTIGFSIAEKLAIVQALDSVIIADGTIHDGELNALNSLMSRFDFESNFILQARNLPEGQGLLILDAMTPLKKRTLRDILEEMAIADGFIHQKESTLLANIFLSIGILQEQV